MKIIYISGPISNCLPEGYDELHGRQLNVLNASQVARRCIAAGWAVICPHKNTSMFYDIPWKETIDMDLELVRRSDAILMIGKWQLSPGALKEMKLAQELGKEIYLLDADGIPPVEKEGTVAPATPQAGQGGPDVTIPIGGMNSTQMIGRVESRWNELRRYGFEWRSFYNGWIEGRADLNTHAIIIHDQGDRNNSAAHATAYASDLARRGRGVRVLRGEAAARYRDGLDPDEIGISVGCIGNTLDTFVDLKWDNTDEGVIG